MHTPPSRLLAVLIAISVIVPLSFATAGSKTTATATKVSKIVSVDATTKSVTINNGATNNTKSGGQAHNVQTFTVTDFTNITVNGLKATLADLKPGMSVDINIGMDRGTLDSIVAYNSVAAPTPVPSKGGKGKGPAGPVALGKPIDEDKIVEVGTDTVTIGQMGHPYKAYKVTKITQIIVNREKKDLSALRVGMKVQVKISTDPTTLESIEATD